MTSQTSIAHGILGSGGNTVVYLGIAILLIAIAVISFYLASSPHPHTKPPSNSTTNSTTPPDTPRAIFLSDAKKFTQAGSLHLLYFGGNYTQTIQSGNSILEVLNTQYISSYKMGQDLRSTFSQNITVKNKNTGATINSTNSTLYYYNTLYGELTCLNQTKHSGGKSNTTLKCYQGNGGLSELSKFPFNLSDAGSIAELLVGNNISYTGPRYGIGGRPCDLFSLSSNQTGTNFTTMDICLDKQYGVPLYFNSTSVLQNQIYSTNLLLALNFSTNVTAEDFAIPAAYRNQTYI